MTPVQMSNNARPKKKAECWASRKRLSGASGTPSQSTATRAVARVISVTLSLVMLADGLGLRTSTSPQRLDLSRLLYLASCRVS